MNDGRAAIAALFDACSCAWRRIIPRHGWSAGGTHFRLAMETGTCLASRAGGAASRTLGRAGAGDGDTFTYWSCLRA